MDTLPINQIVCGDCLEVMKDWPNNCVDLVLTDPPYGGVLNKTHGHGKLKEAVARYGGGDWDYRPATEVFQRMIAIGKHSIIWGGNYFASSLPDSRCWLVWDKQNGESTFADCELAWASLDMAVRKYVLHVSSIRDRQHPTQKPIGLLLWCLSFTPDKLILDPFCGSGTTCVAAKMLGRHYIGIDISEEYCEIARMRLKAVDCGVSAKELKEGQMPLFA